MNRRNKKIYKNKKISNYPDLLREYIDREKEILTIKK